jgi:hypothetical protein
VIVSNDSDYAAKFEDYYNSFDEGMMNRDGGGERILPMD